jgi:hypothetical protein
LNVKVKSPESLPVSRIAETSFLCYRSLDLGSRKTAASGDQSHRPDRDPRRKADRDVDDLAVKAIRSAGVEVPGVVLAEGDAIAALHDRTMEQLGCQAGVVVVQPVQHLGSCGAAHSSAPGP